MTYTKDIVSKYTGMFVFTNNLKHYSLYYNFNIFTMKQILLTFLNDCNIFYYNKIFYETFYIGLRENLFTRLLLVSRNK